MGRGGQVWWFARVGSKHALRGRGRAKGQGSGRRALQLPAARPPYPPTCFGGLKGGGELGQELSLVDYGHEQAAWQRGGWVLAGQAAVRRLLGASRQLPADWRGARCCLRLAARPTAGWRRRTARTQATSAPTPRPAPHNLALLSPTPTCLQPQDSAAGAASAAGLWDRCSARPSIAQTVPRTVQACSPLAPLSPQPASGALHSRGLRGAAQAAPEISGHQGPLLWVEEHSCLLGWGWVGGTSGAPGQMWASADSQLLILHPPCTCPASPSAHPHLPLHGQPDLGVGAARSRHRVGDGTQNHFFVAGWGGGWVGRSGVGVLRGQ